MTPARSPAWSQTDQEAAVAMPRALAVARGWAARPQGIEAELMLLARCASWMPSDDVVATLHRADEDLDSGRAKTLDAFQHLLRDDDGNNIDDVADTEPDWSS